MAEELRVTAHCRISYDELEWRFSGSGGPGGQHANTSNTRVEVRFNINDSPSLGPRQRARLLERIGPVIRVVSAESRSQGRNRDLALDRLLARLRDALHVERERRPTKPTKGSKTRRLDAKKRRGDIKKGRRPQRPE